MESHQQQKHPDPFDPELDCMERSVVEKSECKQSVRQVFAAGTRSGTADSRKCRTPEVPEV